MIYIALLDAQAAGRVQSITAGFGRIVVVSNATDLVRETSAAADTCALLDPTLISRRDAEHIADRLQATPHTLVVYAPIAREALETSVILARRTAAHFVFHGIPNERAALARVLLLAPDASLSNAVVEAIGPQLDGLPTQLRLTIATILRTAAPPSDADALASQAGLPRRSMDRALEQAGLQSSRFFLAAARILKAYRAVTSSQLPFRQVGAMAGYGTTRTLDDHFFQFFGCSTASARRHPPTPEDAVSALATCLTTRSSQRLAVSGNRPPKPRSSAKVLEIHTDEVRDVAGSNVRSA